MEELREFLTSKHVDKRLRKKVMIDMETFFKKKSAKEEEEVLSMLPPKYKKLLGVLREFDCDGDGIMNLGELRLMLKMLHERAGEEPPPVAHLLKVFEQAHGGRHPEELNVAELDAVLAECPFSVQMAARQGASGSPTGDRWARNTTFVAR